LIIFKTLLFIFTGLLPYEFIPSQALFKKEWRANEPLVIDGIQMKGFACFY